MTLTSNPIDKTAKRTVVDGILTVKQAKDLLSKSPHELIPYVAIGLFAGLRRSELVELRWEEINLRSANITVKADIAKSARRRLVKILPNLKAWLAPYKKDKPSGKLVLSDTTFRKTFDQARKDANLFEDWPNNALRHSYASYHLAKNKSADELAHEMGHTSSQLLYQHYRELVQPSEAKKFWAIRPKK